MQNEDKLKMSEVNQKLKMTLEDLLPWQAEMITAYLPSETIHIHALFALKDGEVVCGFEMTYCYHTDKELNFTGWLN